MSVYYSRIAILLIILIILWSPALSSDWPCWRGPDGNGHSNASDWNPAALKVSANILWRKNIGNGHSAVSVKEERLYTLGNKLSITDADTLYQDIVYCLDAITGEEIWTFAYAADPGNYPGPVPTPAVDGSTVFSLSRWCDLFCLDASAGTVIWRNRVTNDTLMVKYYLDFYASPLICNDLLIINAGISGMAFNKKTGTRIWGEDGIRHGFASPILMDDEVTILMPCDTTIHCIRAATGTIIWSFPWETIADPLLTGERILLSGARVRKGSALIQMENRMPMIVWKSRAFLGVFQSPVVIDGFAYGFGFQSATYQPLQCIDLLNGQIQWEVDYGRWSNLMAAGNHIIILNNDGDLIIGKASPRSFEEISRINVLPIMNQDGNHIPRQRFCWTTPVLANGLIYCRDTHGVLVCVDFRECVK